MLLTTLLDAIDAAEGRSVSVICGERYTIDVIGALGRRVLNVTTGEIMLIVWRDNDLLIDRLSA